MSGATPPWWVPALPGGGGGPATGDRTLTASTPLTPFVRTIDEFFEVEIDGETFRVTVPASATNGEDGSAANTTALDLIAAQARRPAPLSP